MLDPTMITPEWWIISDTHWGHDNIVGYCNRPSNHDRLMMDNWKRLVKPGDNILHLGDVMLGSSAEWMIKRLTGNKFYIKGNHDHKTQILKLLGFERVMPFEALGIAFSHKPIPGDKLGAKVNIHGHIHEGILGAGWDHPRYINVSVEQLDYTPVKLGALIEEFKGRGYDL